ncbi:hypothetical protein KQH27_00720 [bacterium]|nr:hypothetical protein [bacterium]
MVLNLAYTVKRFFFALQLIFPAFIRPNKRKITFSGSNWLIATESEKKILMNWVHERLRNQSYLQKISRKRRTCMAKKKINYTDLVHDSIRRFKKIREQDPGDNEVFTATINEVIQDLHERNQEDWEKRNTEPKKRSKTYSPEILPQKGTDKNE